MQELSESTPTISLQLPSQVKGQGSKDKGKAKMIEPEKPLKKKDHIKFDKEEALRLQAKFDEEDRLTREKAQKLAQRLQAQEQKELSDAEKATLFVQLLEKRRKHFTAKRAKKKRNRPPIKAQQRSFMCTYLKNMEGWKPKDLEINSFANIQDLFDKAMKRRAGEALEQESSKKQKVDDDKETKELKQCMDIISDDGDDVTIEATPLSTKSPTITTFEHPLEDNVWKNQQGLVKVLNWKLFDSCGAHCVTMQNIRYYLLVEKMYPLTKHTLHQMFNDVKLKVDYDCEMAFELLRLVKKQLKEGYGRIVGIKSLLEVTAVKLVLLVQKLLLLVLKVNAAGTKITTAERLQLLKR
ncbi:hypothetical protein Tco_0364139 [Tanacetum coccineum]